MKLLTIVPRDILSNREVAMMIERLDADFSRTREHHIDDDMWFAMSGVRHSGLVVHGDSPTKGRAELADWADAIVVIRASSSDSPDAFLRTRGVDGYEWIATVRFRRGRPTVEAPDEVQIEDGEWLLDLVRSLAADRLEGGPYDVEVAARSAPDEPPAPWASLLKVSQDSGRRVGGFPAPGGGFGGVGSGAPSPGGVPTSGGDVSSVPVGRVMPFPWTLLALAAAACAVLVVVAVALGWVVLTTDLAGAPS